MERPNRRNKRSSVERLSTDNADTAVGDVEPLAVEQEPITPVSPPAIPGGIARADDYDPALADSAIKLPKLVLNHRFWEVSLSLVRFFIVSFLSTLFPEKRLTEEERARARAQEIRELLFDLGPTFIKLGQFLSVRRDVLPLEVAEELAMLQDKVPPFDQMLVRETIISDLGSTPEELFRMFSEKPIASASIGQVHKVQLKDGRLAVIKVQRPNLASEFYRDLGLMRLMARIFTRFNTAFVKLTGKQNKNAAAIQGWLALSDEFGRTLFSEIDYLREGKNADRLRRQLRSNTRIRVPRVIWKYTGRHVLTLEYVEGIKISQVNELRRHGFDLTEIGNLLVNCYLEQFVLYGFFHADPHAGNLAIDEYGNLVIYDYGMMGEITEAQRRSLLNCVISVVRRQPEKVTRHLIELGIVSSEASVDAVTRTITPFIEYYAGKDILELDFQNLEHDVDQVIAERSFRLPANLAYLLRAGSSLEGIARTLKPDFSFVAAVKPVMTRWALQQGFQTLARNGNLLEFAEFALSQFGKAIKSNPNERALSEPSTLTQTPEETGSLKVTAEIDSNPPAKCITCDRQSREVQGLHKNLKKCALLGIMVLTATIGESLSLSTVDPQDYRQLSLYFLIGNTVLGAIIFWKFIKLINWTRSTEVEKTKGSAE